MSKRWTIQELNGLDIFTFAMCILSERREGLNQEAPLAKKLKCASSRLEDLRDICREDENYTLGLISAKEAIYRAVYAEHQRADILKQLGLDPDDAGKCYVNLHGLTPEAVAADREIMRRIVELLDKCDGEGDYWDNVDYSISNAVKDFLEARKEETP